MRWVVWRELRSCVGWYGVNSIDDLGALSWISKTRGLHLGGLACVEFMLWVLWRESDRRFGFSSWVFKLTWVVWRDLARLYTSTFQLNVSNLCWMH